MTLSNIDKFFSLARERYSIKLRRESGAPPPWTEDPVFQEWRFCNVHREDDRTTIWFRENVRQHLDGLQLIEATVAFRWFNAVSTGERILDLLLHGWDSDEAKRRLAGVKPIVTGAYKIGSPTGMPKLDGILQNIDVARRQLPYRSKWWGKSLRSAWNELRDLPFLGGFLAYEPISDLRWTPVLNQATDIMTWAHAGPGCARGLGFVTTGQMHIYNFNSREDQSSMREVMQELLRLSRDPMNWPADWPAWEMREVEHWCCETAKYVQGRAGIRLKRRYKPREASRGQ